MLIPRLLQLLLPIIPISGIKLIEKRLTLHTLKDFGGKTAYGIDLDGYGFIDPITKVNNSYMRDHETYAGYSDTRTSPDVTPTQPSTPKLSPHVVLDSSHAVRFVWIAKTLHRLSTLLTTDLKLPYLNISIDGTSKTMKVSYEELEKYLSNQVIYHNALPLPGSQDKVPTLIPKITSSRNHAAVRFSNFFDGSNGWYTPDSGKHWVPPGNWGTAYVPMSGYGILAQSNPNFSQLENNILALCTRVAYKPNNYPVPACVEYGLDYPRGLDAKKTTIIPDHGHYMEYVYKYLEFYSSLYNTPPVNQKASSRSEY